MIRWTAEAIGTEQPDGFEIVWVDAVSKVGDFVISQVFFELGVCSFSQLFHKKITKEPEVCWQRIVILPQLRSIVKTVYPGRLRFRSIMAEITSCSSMVKIERASWAESDSKLTP